MPQETVTSSGTTTTTTGLDPERLFQPLEIRAMIRDINPVAVRREVERLLSKPRCAAFVRELLKRAEETAAPDNTMLDAGDVLKVFDRVVAQKGFIRQGAPGSDQFFANVALGSIGRGTASIQIGRHMPGLPVKGSDLDRVFAEFDARIALHETIHHTGKLIYDDGHLSRVVLAMIEDVSGLDNDVAFVINRHAQKTRPLPANPQTLDFSHYWDAALQISYS